MLCVCLVFLIDQALYEDVNQNQSDPPESDKTPHLSPPYWALGLLDLGSRMTRSFGLKLPVLEETDVEDPINGFGWRINQRGVGSRTRGFAGLASSLPQSAIWPGPRKESARAKPRARCVWLGMPPQNRLVSKQPGSPAAIDLFSMHVSQKTDRDSDKKATTWLSRRLVLQGNQEETSNL